MLSLKNRIEQLRKEKGLTLKDLANEFNEFTKNYRDTIKPISYATLSRWEKGVNDPPSKSMEKLATYFDVPVGYLQGVTDEKELTAKYALDILDDIYLQRFEKFKSINNNSDNDIELDNLPVNDKKTVGSILRNFELDISDIIQSFSYSSEILEALKIFENSIYRATESVAIVSDKEKAQKFEAGLLFALYQATLLVNEMAIDDLLSDKNSIESIKKTLYGTNNQKFNNDPDTKN